MRLRTGLGAGLVAVAIVAAIAVLRTQSAPAVPPDSQPAPAPGVDALSRSLTTDLRHTTLLPPTVRFADDPDAPPGFVFQRYTSTEANHTVTHYTAQGLLVRTKDNAVLDHVMVTVSPANGQVVKAADVARCEPDEEFGGDSCTQAAPANGVVAIVIRDPVFTRIVPSDATTGAPPGLLSELEAAYPNGTLLTIALTSVHTASIPLDETAMLKLADIPGISAALSK
ncbi:MAG TPA: hypothetical protein VH352_12030 [Pseudonocardiaceae bacterium]|nr:hypothetical protein [Pseudonocardiaceae bacterium]